MADPPSEDLGAHDATGQRLVATRGDEDVPARAATDGTPVGGRGAGETVGRYVILERIGHGAMGVVYGAYDPQLDRKVALKLLVSERSHATHSNRLLREAQAMARLSHPNVVSVHDVGTVDERVFIAMEFVEGQTLHSWLNTERSVAERLQKLVDAGRGLVAAHAAGLLHRDFKPDNVMVGDDGRVRVMDFGLARAHDARSDEGEPAQTPPRESPGPRVMGSALSTDLTRTGAVMGTPAYMSPEQFEGLPVDARSDQFSFFVSLYEALYGRRPADADSFFELAALVTRGEISPPPHDARVPSRVRRAIERGLSIDPADRFASMEAALAELVVRPPRRWSIVVGIAALGTISAVAWAGRVPEAPTPCAATSAETSTRWGHDARSRIRAAFAGTGAPFAASAAEGVVRALDDSHATLVAAQRSTCQATHVHGTQSEAMLDRRMECLDRQLAAFEAVITVLETADVDAAERGLQLVLDLPSVRTCAALSSVDPAVPSPGPAEAEAVKRLRAELDRQWTNYEAGQQTRALEAVSALREEIDALGYLPLQAEHRWVVGTMRDREPGAAKTDDLLVALTMATEIGDDALALRALESLASKASRAGDDDTAHSWIALFGALVARRGERLDERLSLHRLRGANAAARGQHRRAVTELERALELGRQGDGITEVVRASVHADLGRNRAALHEIDRAREHFETALQGYEDLFGADHPAVGRLYLRIAGTASVEGDHGQAIAWERRATKTLEAAFGPGSPKMAEPYNLAAVVYARAGEFGRAGELFESALSVVGAGPEGDRIRAGTHTNYGTSLWFEGRFEDALVEHTKALEDTRSLGGADDLATAEAEDNLAATLTKLGRPREALPLHRAAFAKFERNLDLDHPTLAISARDQASALIAVDRLDEALSLLTRAERIYRRRADETDPAALAEVRVTIVETLRRRGKGTDVARAQMIATQVDAVLQQLGSRAEGLRARLDPEPG